MRMSRRRRRLRQRAWRILGRPRTQGISRIPLLLVPISMVITGLAVNSLAGITHAQYADSRSTPVISVRSLSFSDVIQIESNVTAQPRLRQSERVDQTLLVVRNISNRKVKLSVEFAGVPGLGVRLPQGVLVPGKSVEITLVGAPEEAGAFEGTVTIYGMGEYLKFSVPVPVEVEPKPPESKCGPAGKAEDEKGHGSPIEVTEPVGEAAEQADQAVEQPDEAAGQADEAMEPSNCAPPPPPDCAAEPVATDENQPAEQVVTEDNLDSTVELVNGLIETLGQPAETSDGSEATETPTPEACAEPPVPDCPTDPGLDRTSATVDGAPANEQSEPESCDQSALPTDEQTPPTDEQTPPADGQTPPADEQTPPADEQTPPAEEQTPPAEEQAPPAEEQAHPVEEQTPPVEEQTPPAEEQAPPTEEQAPPTEEQAPPAEEQARLAEEQAPPVEEQAPPADNQAPPADNQAPPADGQGS